MFVKFQVMVTDSPIRLLCFTLCISLSLATVCPPGEQYWDPERESCTNCTRCDLKGYVVLRPCVVHLDTLCGNLSDLRIDWSRLTGNLHHNIRHHHRRKEHRGERHHAVTEGFVTGALGKSNFIFIYIYLISSSFKDLIPDLT